MPKRFERRRDEVSLAYVKPERIDLKSHPEFNERWLQDCIADDPAILGLGDLGVIEREYWDVERRRYPAYEHSLRTDDESEEEAPSVDRAYWTQKASAKAMAMVDALVAIANEGGTSNYQPAYNKRHVGLRDSVGKAHFIRMIPRLEFVNLRARVADKAQWCERFEAVGLNAVAMARRACVNVGPAELGDHRDILRAFVHQARAEHDE